MSFLASEILDQLLEVCDLDVADKISFKDTLDEASNSKNDARLACRVLRSVSLSKILSPLVKAIGSSWLKTRQSRTTKRGHR